jgi:hypothetical protein
MKKVLLVLVVLFLAVQFWPVDRSNPPGTSPLTAPPEVTAILEASCNDCHTNETRWPWYSRVAPVSIWIAHHVEEGRAELNLSNWGEYSASRADHKLEELVELVENGEMPLPSYLWGHGDARLSPEQVETLVGWAEATRAELAPAVEAERREAEGEQPPAAPAASEPGG